MPRQFSALQEIRGRLYLALAVAFYNFCIVGVFVFAWAILHTAGVPRRIYIAVALSKSPLTGGNNILSLAVAVAVAVAVAA